jgi:hypothetical protein
MLKVLGLLLVAAGLSPAATIIFTTPTGSTAGGNAVSAEADFVFSAGQVVITLKNLQSGMVTIGQVLSDLDFVLSNADGSTLVLGATTTMSASAPLGTTTCTTSGCVNDSTVITNLGWGFGTLGTGNTICDVCGTGSNLSIPTGPAGTVPPEHTIIGPNPTTQDGLVNPSHQPFINQQAVFTLSNSLITTSTTVSSVKFSFNTTPDVNVDGCASTNPNCGTTTQSTPEPVGTFLMGSGLLALAFMGRFGSKLRRSSK